MLNCGQLLTIGLNKSFRKDKGNSRQSLENKRNRKLRQECQEWEVHLLTADKQMLTDLAQDLEEIDLGVRQSFPIC